MAEKLSPETKQQELKKLVNNCYYRLLQTFKFDKVIPAEALGNIIFQIRGEQYTDEIIKVLLGSGRIEEEYFMGKKRYALTEPKK